MDGVIYEGDTLRNNEKNPFFSYLVKQTRNCGYFDKSTKLIATKFIQGLTLK